MPPILRSGRLGFGAGALRDRTGGAGGTVDVEAQRSAFTELLAELRRRLEPVLHEQMQVVALVQNLDADFGVQLAEPAGLAVLLRDELLVERGDLDVEVVRRQVEIGAERLYGPTVTVAFQREGTRLVGPFDAVEVEELGELALRVVSEADGLVWERRLAHLHLLVSRARRPTSCPRGGQLAPGRRRARCRRDRGCSPRARRRPGRATQCSARPGPGARRRRDRRPSGRAPSPCR